MVIYELVQMFGCDYLFRMLLMVRFMRLFWLLPPQSALSLTMMLFSWLWSWIQGSLVPFESPKAIDHPLVCHVSGELTSGNYASDDFSLETALCCPAPLSTARTAGVIAGAGWPTMWCYFFPSASLSFVLFSLPPLLFSISSSYIFYKQLGRRQQM